jgi:hydroxypyruvate reductase
MRRTKWMTSRDALRADAHACLAAGLAAVEPMRLIAGALARASDALVLRAPDGREVARHRGPVRLVGAGKAAAGMSRAAAAIVGDALDGGVVVAPERVAAPPRVRALVASHPVPDATSVASTAELLALAEGAGAETLVLVLLSGGASALLCAPADGLTLADKQVVTRALLDAGADIGAFNTVRKHCSRVKGGGLARAAAGAAGCWTLVLSDVVGDDLATIASGPTVGDPTTFADALAALSRYGVMAPAAVAERLRRGAAGAIPETPKPGDPPFARAHTRLVGTNADAVAAIADEARRRGYAVVVRQDPLVGDAAAAGADLATAVLALDAGRVALVAGGETLVRAKPGGLGGRSQHLALAAASALAGHDAVLLAAGTDGIDGPTHAAGGCVDGETIARARAAGVDVAAALSATDSHRALAATGDLVVTGRTGTNVADVVVALRAAAV